MNKSATLIILLGILIAFTSCIKRGQTPYQSNVTGKAGELVVVINPEAWKAEPGKTVKKILTQPQLALPQDEPLFDLTNIPREAFGDIFKTSRNLLIATISSSVEKNTVRFKSNVHAYTQAVVYVDAKNQADFVKIMNDNADKIVAFFLKKERDRIILNYKNYYLKEIAEKTSEQFNIEILVPPGFEIDKTKEDFMWIRYETPEISQGIFIYEYPYTDDSTFTSDYLVSKRNVFLHKYVPGPLKGSYMTTEPLVPVLFNQFTKNGNYAAEIRGLWRLENDFMGGPFISHSMLDVLNNRIVTIEGFVYAPSQDKRNLLRQVEAMVYSAKFVNQAEIDKINEQYTL